MKTKFLIWMVVVFFSTDVYSQEDSTSSNNFDHKVLPFAFYLPQTSVGLGGLGIFSFKIKKESDNRNSQVLYSAAYTLENQLLLYFPYQIHLNNDKKRIIGEAGYYRYFYQFYGLGNNTPAEDEETYRVNFPRFYMQFMQRIKGNHFIGAGFKFDAFDIVELEEEGNLNQQDILGKEGGNTFVESFNYLFDTRDNIAFPLKGSYLNIEYDLSLKDVLSDYSYSKVTIDARHFHQIKGDLVWANHVYFSNANKGTPFYQLPRISSQKIARGYDNRRFIDYQLANIQTEMRFPIHNRVHGAAFISGSNVGNEINGNSLKLSGGMGLRYVVNEREKTRARIDIGVGKDSFNFYFTINEAF